MIIKTVTETFSYESDWNRGEPRGDARISHIYQTVGFSLAWLWPLCLCFYSVTRPSCSIPCLLLKVNDIPTPDSDLGEVMAGVGDEKIMSINWLEPCKCNDAYLVLPWGCHWTKSAPRNEHNIVCRDDKLGRGERLSRHIKKMKFHISLVRKGNGFNIITQLTVI